jgi:hypothetical protein
MHADENPTLRKRNGESHASFNLAEAHKLAGSTLETEGNFSPTLIDLGSQPRSALVDDSVASRFLGITIGTLSVWRSNGRYSLPYIKIGRRVRYRVGDILDELCSKVVDEQLMEAAYS